MKEVNKAWGLQKRIIKMVESSTTKKVLGGLIDLNTAPMEHLKMMDLPLTVLNALVLERDDHPFKSVDDIKMRMDKRIFGSKNMRVLQRHVLPMPEDLVDPLDGLPGVAVLQQHVNMTVCASLVDKTT